jgi:predicted DNA-binding helix-hairpin-helix protein
MPKGLLQKLEILADAAKYDASCASSGGARRTAGDGGIGSVTGAGICHAYTPDGRCVSLLKILLTNFCRYDCAYCVSRRSSNVERAKFSVAEVVGLTLDLYRRNCIEGLASSSPPASRAARTTPWRTWCGSRRRCAPSTASAATST